MRRLAIPLVACLLVVGACSGATSGGSATVTEAPTDTGVSTTSPDATTSSGIPDTTMGTTTTASGRPVAPDFTLELGEGGTYTLSEGAKPVYLVFWAEW